MRGLLILLLLMRCSMYRLASATLLLAVMVFTTLPRTLFHHCEEGAWSAGLNARQGTVHVDAHCPICEAAFPICDSVTDSSFHMERTLLWTRDIERSIAPVQVTLATLRSRGPPRLG